ncbi:MAG: hypothetical protein AAF492_23670, partial [Verrucomicrobiota bacterium]
GEEGPILATWNLRKLNGNGSGVSIHLLVNGIPIDTRAITATETNGVTGGFAITHAMMGDTIDIALSSWGLSHNAEDGSDSSLFGADIHQVDFFPPDLSLTKTVDRTSLLVGESNLTYTLFVTNLGTSAISSVTVTDTIPDHVIVLSAAPPVAFTNGNGYVFNLGLLTGGATTSIVINAAITNPIPIVLTNVAEVATTNLDVHLENNIDSVVTIVMPPPPPERNIALIKTVSSTNLLIGTNLVWTITVTNVGTGTVGGVVVTDSVPSNVTLISSSQPANRTNGNDYVFDLGFLSLGGSTSITLQAAVTLAQPGAITNWASASTTNAESILTNNIDRAITLIPDSDGDGTANPADPDDDNDTFSDAEELIAGTDPLDANSFLWLQIDVTGTQFVHRLTFPTALGRTYRVERSFNLHSNDWTPVASNLPGLGTLRNLSSSNAAARVYYRIGVEQP